MRLVQIQHKQLGRKVARVDEPLLTLINGFSSVFDIADHCLAIGESLTQVIAKKISNDTLSYDQIYTGRSAWHLLPAFDHPRDPLHCMLSGTGLTHKASAENRHKMHEAQEKMKLTDSMKIYEWGVQWGKPPKNAVGIQPEWFYKGNGTNLKGHGVPLEVPIFADDGGEEPEVAGIYLIDKNGVPHRLGIAATNEFSDHVMERKNYLYLAPSKIRSCSLGPELVLDSDFEDISGHVSIRRKGVVVWEKDIQTGEANMSHSLANLEYHHFKYPNHLVPGQVHIHFYGADAFSFGDGFQLQHNDLMEIAWKGLGRPLVNPISIVDGEEKMMQISELS